MRPEEVTDRNAILAALDTSDRAALAPFLTRIPLDRNLVLHEADERIEYCCFPEDGVASLVTVHDGAPLTEIGIIGKEGYTGSAVLLGAVVSPHRAFMQVAGVSGLRIAATDLCNAVDQRPSLRRTLLRFIQVFVVQVASSATSNGHGRLEQRLARWLLMCHDRLDSNDVALTHDFIATMITAQRTGVTDALHVLESRGLIRSLRGRVVISDRAGLEALAGDSYGLPEAEHRRLFGAPRRLGGSDGQRGPDSTPPHGGSAAA